MNQKPIAGWRLTRWSLTLTPHSLLPLKFGSIVSPRFSLNGLNAFALFTQAIWQQTFALRRAETVVDSPAYFGVELLGLHVRAFNHQATATLIRTLPPWTGHE